MGESKKSSKNKIIAAVSGGFDPIHIGHVRLFQEAKKMAHQLVVILNNDNWLKNKKGYVFMPEHERKEIIEAIVGVDRVVLTSHKEGASDMSVCRELEELKPNLFVNGGDRYKDNIPEVAVCERINCKMIFNAGHGGKIQSSSWLINNYKKIHKLEEAVAMLSTKKLLAFDLDGTLTTSKHDIDEVMITLLCKLLDKVPVAVIGGGNYPQFKKQFLNYLKCPKDRLKNLFVLPTSGGRMYTYTKGKWSLIYKNNLTKKEKTQIINAFQKAFKDTRYIKPNKTYGKVIEDRESQITFSALGQKAPLVDKEKWNQTQDVRPQLKKALKKYLPEFEVRLGGLTSIDVTKKGIDKAYGIRQVQKRLSIPIRKMAYVGDALYKGGNDFSVVKTGIDTAQIANVEETKYLIRKICK